MKCLILIFVLLFVVMPVIAQESDTLSLREENLALKKQLLTKDAMIKQLVEDLNKSEESLQEYKNLVQVLKYQVKRYSGIIQRWASLDSNFGKLKEAKYQEQINRLQVQVEKFMYMVKQLEDIVNLQEERFQLVEKRLIQFFGKKFFEEYLSDIFVPIAKKKKKK